MSDNSGTLPTCPLCGSRVVPFGTMRHRFIAEDLGGQEICTGCARKVTPAQVAAAEEAERRWNSERSP
jgi:hypothetical protein